MHPEYFELILFPDISHTVYLKLCPKEERKEEGHTLKLSHLMSLFQSCLELAQQDIKR